VLCSNSWAKKSSTESLTEQLEKIADLGKKEKWLIHGSILHIRQGEIMGAGTFGIVLGGLLYDTPVAVKVPRLSDMGSTDSYLHELANELRILRSLQHPNIVSFLGACVEPEVGDLALILELVEGPTVHDYVLDSKAVPSRVERYALVTGICSGLCYLHRQSPKIVHGDLKGKNILVERCVPNPRPKLLDFGLSRMLTKHARPLGGTLEYMAPEVALKKTSPNCSADVFSFGCVAFFVMTGKRPRGDMDRRAILKHMASRECCELPWPDGMCSEFVESKRTINQCVAQQAYLRPCMGDVNSAILSWPLASSLESCAIADLKQLASKRCQPNQSDMWYQSVVEVREQLDGSKPRSTTHEEKKPANLCTHTSQNRVQEPLASTEERTQGSLVFPNLLPTPNKTIMTDLVSTMFGWNTLVPPDSCCALHHNWKIVASLSSEVHLGHCSDLGYASPIQCAECGLVDEFLGESFPARWICSYHEKESQLSVSQTMINEMLTQSL